MTSVWTTHFACTQAPVYYRIFSFLVCVCVCACVCVCVCVHVCLTARERKRVSVGVSVCRVSAYLCMHVQTRQIYCIAYFHVIKLPQSLTFRVTSTLQVTFRPTTLCT